MRYLRETNGYAQVAHGITAGWSQLARELYCTAPEFVRYDGDRYAPYCTVHISTLPWLLCQRDLFEIAMAAVVLFCGGISKLSYIVSE